MALGNRLDLPIWRSKYILWIVLMIPGTLMIAGWINGKMTYHNLMHATGEFSGRFLMFSLIATPLVMLLPKYTIPKWLNRNKRYFGIAAFAYCTIHTIAYFIQEPLEQVLNEFFQVSILTGWVAFLIWIPMAITSTDGWVTSLKGKWKKIHNWGYLAAILAYLHWALVHMHWKPALVHAMPVIILQGYRWIRQMSK